MASWGIMCTFYTMRSLLLVVVFLQVVTELFQVRKGIVIKFIKYKQKNDCSYYPIRQVFQVCPTQVFHVFIVLKIRGFGLGLLGG